jgi:hypothetical protein
MAAKGVMRATWTRAALWAGVVQFTLVLFGVVQAYLIVRGLPEHQTTRDKALGHAFQDGLSWGLGQLVISGLLIGLGWLGSRRTHGLDVRPGALRVTFCAVLLFVSAQALAYGLTAALATRF